MQAVGADDQIELARLRIVERDPHTIVVLVQGGDAAAEEGLNVALDGAIDRCSQIPARKTGEVIADDPAKDLHP